MAGCRHIGTAGLENPQQGNDHFRPATQTDGDPAIGFHAQGDQAMGQLVGPAVELRVAEQRPGVAAHGTGVWTLGGLLLDQLVDQHVTRIVAGGGVEFDLQTATLVLGHQREVRDGGVVMLQHRFEHREHALLEVLGFFETEIGSVEVEVQVHVFVRVVIAHEDRHGRLLVTVVNHQYPRQGATVVGIAVEAFERERDVEQLAPAVLRQTQAAVEFGDGESLVAIAAAQLSGDGIHQVQQRALRIDRQTNRADRGKHAAVERLCTGMPTTTSSTPTVRLK